MVQTAAATKPLHSCQRWAEVDAILANDGDDRLGLALPREREGAVRKQLTAYADSLPHHDLAEFGQHVRITRVDEFYCYKADLRFLTEQRAVRRQEKPYKGAPVPPAKNTEASLDVWAIRLPAPAAFQKATVEHPVEDSQVVRQCEGCGGQGSVPCDGCTGNKVVACWDCRGSGTVPCGRCGGDRFFKTQTGTQQKTKNCTNCQGGRIGEGMMGPDNRGWVCPECNGKGWTTYDEPVFQMMPCPCKTGLTRCSTCEGHKQVRCSKCSGHGRLTCGKCQGAAKIVSSLVISQTLTPGSVNGSAPNAVVENAVVKQLDEQNDFAPFLQLATTEVPQGITLKNGSKGLQYLLNSSFGKCFEGLPTGSRVARQALTVSRASVLLVEYQYDGQSYVAWLIGSRMRVYAPTSPLSGVVEEKVEEAVNLWEQKKRLAAARVLNEAMDLGRKDPACGRALEKLLPQLPGLLRFCGQHYRKRVPALVVGSVLAVAVLLVVGVLVVNTMREGAKQRAIADEEARSVELLGELDLNAPVKVEDVARDFKTAPFAARKKYDGKTFTLVGPVRNKFSQSSISLEAGDVFFGSGVRCDFGVQQRSQVASLPKGAVVTVRGTAAVQLGKQVHSFDMKGCELVAVPGQ